ncbi:MAG: methylated-DNA--[protein]-cysteine S-methyltransferase [Eggerthellaceae bacterium]|jgi:methylated-DNA-[protein]-cysteine S-methyltransferase
MNEKLSYYSYVMPHGKVTIRASRRGITDLVFDAVKMDGVEESTRITNEAATQLQEYFAGKRHEFNLALDLKGSTFQKEVWNEIMRIPYGTTATSAEIAEAMGKPGSYRNVGTAVTKNPIAIIIPDHRVVGAQGSPLGNGRKASIRRGLLAAELRNAASGIRPV